MTDPPLEWQSEIPLDGNWWFCDPDYGQPFVIDIETVRGVTLDLISSDVLHLTKRSIFAGPLPGPPELPPDFDLE